MCKAWKFWAWWLWSAGWLDLGCIPCNRAGRPGISRVLPAGLTGNLRVLQVGQSLVPCEGDPEAGRVAPAGAQCSASGRTEVPAGLKDADRSPSRTGPRRSLSPAETTGLAGGASGRPRRGRLSPRPRQRMRLPEAAGAGREGASAVRRLRPRHTRCDRKRNGRALVPAGPGPAQRHGGGGGGRAGHIPAALWL